MRVSLLLVFAFAIAASPPKTDGQAPTPQPPNTAGLQAFEINTLLMEATVKLEGRDERNQPLFGTGFFMGRPLEKEPNRSAYVLITAAHVLNEMKGDVIVVYFTKEG